MLLFKSANIDNKQSCSLWRLLLLAGSLVFIVSILDLGGGSLNIFNQDGVSGGGGHMLVEATIVHPYVLWTLIKTHFKASLKNLLKLKYHTVDKKVHNLGKRATMERLVDRVEHPPRADGNYFQTGKCGSMNIWNAPKVGAAYCTNDHNEMYRTPNASIIPPAFISVPSSGQFPSYVKLHLEGYHNKTKYDDYCSGVLVEPNLVLTARRCIKEGEIYRIHASVGVNPLDTRISAQQTYKVDSYCKLGAGSHALNDTHWHPELNDLALLKLDHSFEMTKYIQPACVDIQQPHLKDAQCFAVGLGRRHQLVMLPVKRGCADERLPHKQHHADLSCYTSNLNDVKDPNGKTCMKFLGSPIYCIDRCSKDRFIRRSDRNNNNNNIEPRMYAVGVGSYTLGSSAYAKMCGYQISKNELDFAYFSDFTKMRERMIKEITWKCFETNKQTLADMETVKPKDDTVSVSLWTAAEGLKKETVALK